MYKEHHWKKPCADDLCNLLYVTWSKGFSHQPWQPLMESDLLSSIHVASPWQVLWITTFLPVVRQDQERVHTRFLPVYLGYHASCFQVSKGISMPISDMGLDRIYSKFQVQESGRILVSILNLVPWSHSSHWRHCCHCMESLLSLGHGHSMAAKGQYLDESCLSW